MAEKNFKLVDIKKYIKNKYLCTMYSFVSYPLERFLKIDGFNAVYNRLKSLPDHGDFYNRALCAMNISYEVDSQDLKKIPKEGPLIVVSNHPFGGVDGIVLGALLLNHRQDSKMLINALLGIMPEIKDWSITVNPFGGNKATSENVLAMKNVIKHLKDGGCLGTFPSGTVSHLHMPDFSISDPDWNVNVFQIARRTNATIVPVFFEGRNSKLFYLLGLIHPMLRTSFLARELIKHQESKKPFKVRIGSPIQPRKQKEFTSDEELAAWCRINSYVLGKKNKKQYENEVFKYSQIKNLQAKLGKFLPKMNKDMPEIINPIDAKLMVEEINNLPKESVLIDGDTISVYCAEAWQIPNLLLEIGRLREETFREVGEGTGKSFDNDEFDSYYLHLFMWDKQNQQVAGAYRVGRTDKIKNSLGIQGLYVSTLFKMNPEFIDKITPALEMGRSFIANQYQKKRSTLALLWRGIGEYVYRNPKYKCLYGPVSISTEYNNLSKDLMVEFLSEHKTSVELAKYIKAKKPPKVKLKSSEKKALQKSTKNVDHISALISELEIDKKGVPTLLKHYLKLDGQLLAFNVDNQFGNCIDGLIMVDLTKTNPKILKSYMGKDETIEYRKFHGLTTCLDE